MGNQQGDRLHIILNRLLAAFIGKSESEMFPAPLLKSESTECQPLLAFHHGQSPQDMGDFVNIHRSDCYYTLKASSILSGRSVNEISCYCPGGGG
jgi:hypothetical protein